CSGQDYDLVLSILGDPVKGIDKLCMILRRESERSAVTVKFGNQHTIGISRELQAAIGSEVVMLKSLHKVFLSKLRVGHDGRCSALALNRSTDRRKRGRRSWRSTTSLRSTADGVPQNDHTLTEASLLDQLEVKPHTLGEEPFSAADDHGADNHLELVDKTCPYRLRREFRTVNSD